MIKLDLSPYEHWAQRPVADPRRASFAQFMDGMNEILKAQAPTQALHLFQTYAKGGGLLKIAAPTKSQFMRTLKQAEKQGLVTIEIENDTEVDSPDDPVCWIVRLPDQDRVRARTLGDRSFAEIPLSELAALVLEIRVADDFMGKEDIARTILSNYGLQKLTALVERRLDRVYKEYF